MLTFRSFTTPSELLQLLINRYHIQPPSEASAEEKSEFDKVQNVVRLRLKSFGFISKITIFKY